MKTVLIVDDSLYMRSLIKIALRRAGYKIVGEAGTGIEAKELILSLHPDLITLDNILPDISGAELLAGLNKLEVDSKVIVISALHQQSLIEKMKSMGVLGYVLKPFEAEQLVQVVNDAVIRN